LPGGGGGGGGGRRGRGRQRGGDLLHRGVVHRGGDEPRLVRAGRQVDAVGEGGVEERGERGGVLGARAVVVAHVDVGEEDGEQGARRGHPVGDAGSGQRAGGELLDRRRGGLQPPVGGLVGQPQRGQAGRARQRVTRQGAGLVDRPVRGELVHEVGPAAERGGGRATAHHLAEGPQVGVDRVERVPAARRGAEPGHHLVDDEQRPVLVGDAGQRLVEAVAGSDHPHVARRRLGDHRGDPVTGRGERLLHGGHVVVRQHDRVAGGGLGDAGRVRQAQRGHARPGRGQQGV